MPAHDQQHTALPDHVPILVIGAGFAGICAAIKLRASGRAVLVLEKSDDVGGTWLVNTYPGCACDVPSLVYSYSFAPKADWQRAYSPQPQILAYLRDVARDFGVTPHIRFGVALEHAVWDAAASVWRVETTAGPMTAEAIVSATGGLSQPRIPDLPGLASFTGPAWHSAQWRHDVDLTGKRVGVVGTGASAIQFVPHLQRQAAQLTLFQRTATWILPRRDRQFSAWEKRLNRLVPGLQRSRRTAVYLALESRVIGFAHRPKLLELAEKVALAHLRKQVPDERLRAMLTPRFRLGCKRVLMSNEFYPALCADNAAVVADRIVRVVPDGIETESADGTRRHHLLDALVWGTGFAVNDPPIASLVTGVDGRTLADVWAEHGMQALKGTAAAGFPNLFILMGPNTALGHNSVVLMIEAQVAYLVDLLDRADQAGVRALAARPAAQWAHNETLQRRLAKTVWNTGGCTSWYLDSHGRNTTLWPGSTISFIRSMRRADLSDYTVTVATTQPGREAASA